MMTPRCLPVTVCVLLVALVTAEDLHQRYYSDATMDCDETKHNISTTSPVVRKYWLFPDAQMYETSTNSTLHLEFNPVNGTLVVRRIDDDDFGKYICILVHSDNTLSSISHGLNENGAYFGDLLAMYKHRAMIGGIAAGCLFAVISSLCVFWQLRFRQRSQRNKAVDELDRAIADGYDLKAYDNVGADADTKAELQQGNADGVTDLEQKF